MPSKPKKLQGAQSPRALKGEVDPDPIVLQLRKDNAALKSTINRMKTQDGKTEQFFYEVKASLKHMILPEVTDFFFDLKDLGIDDPEVMVLNLSDWHIGADVTPQEIEGFNAFNYAIARARVQYLLTRVIHEVTARRSNTEVDELVVVCNGDMISGDIHGELTWTNEFPVPVQCCRSGMLLAELMRGLAHHFPSIRLEFIVPDNHSRKTVKNQMKQAGMNSENYLVGYICELALQNVDNVEVTVHNAIKTVVKVGHLQYLVEHGHTIRGWAGFPWYGADRSTSREAKSRMFNLDKQFHKMLIGHFHVPMNTQYYIVNGSLTGTTEYDHACGRNAPPGQTCWFVNPGFDEEKGWTAINLHHADDAAVYEETLEEYAPLDAEV